MEDDVKSLLLLTTKEIGQIHHDWNLSAWQPRTGTLIGRLNSAQVAKVLRVLAAVAEDKRSPYYQNTNHVEVFLYRIGKDIEAELVKEAKE